MATVVPILEIYSMEKMLWFSEYSQPVLQQQICKCMISLMFRTIMVPLLPLLALQG